MKGKRDFDKAKQLIKEAGYKGEKIVIISATDQPIVHSQTLLTAEMLRKLGLNVEIQAGDWGTLITRRTSKEPVEKGGWSIFHTWLVGPDLTSPAVNFAVRGSGQNAWFGWPDDPTIEKLRDAWFAATDPASSKKAADAVQARAFDFVPVHPHGAIHPAHRVPHEPERCDHRASDLHVERRKALASTTVPEAGGR